VYDNSDAPFSTLTPLQHRTDQPHIQVPSAAPKGLFFADFLWTGKESRAPVGARPDDLTAPDEISGFLPQNPLKCAPAYKKVN